MALEKSVERRATESSTEDVCVCVTVDDARLGMFSRLTRAACSPSASPSPARAGWNLSPR